MKLVAVVLAALSTASAFVPPAAPISRTGPVKESKADLEALAVKLNPVVKFWDPLGLADGEFWGESQEATIGFLRHAEIKHGRVAMAAFLGFIGGANGLKWPANGSPLDGNGITSAGLTPQAQWDAIPEIAKWQIFFAIAFLEYFGEVGLGDAHYMRGGRPGVYPSFKEGKIAELLPHPVPFDLYDPFGWSKDMSAEKKETRLLAEINNGRLAMIGIMGFVSEAQVPDSVPALKGLVAPYAGNVMIPFEGNFHWGFVGP